MYARPDVKHKHTYMLHNPFSNVTVPLPELDAIIGYVVETFKVRKALMCSPAPDDVIATTTSNWNYNIILCRPGKGCYVRHEFRVIESRSSETHFTGSPRAKNSSPSTSARMRMAGLMLPGLNWSSRIRWPSITTKMHGSGHKKSLTQVTRGLAKMIILMVGERCQVAMRKI
jgi:hypothetical protein